ncbi:MAG TPA: hypothetical protein VJH94_03285 [Candidatus Paceibacterota bacterium]
MKTTRAERILEEIKGLAIEWAKENNIWNGAGVTAQIKERKGGQTSITLFLASRYTSGGKGKRFSFTTNLTSEDWTEIFAFTWSPRERAVLSHMKSQPNRWVSDEELAKKGLTFSTTSINKPFLVKNLPFRVRPHLEGGINYRLNRVFKITGQIR